MNQVFVQAAVSADLKNDSFPALKAFPLWRRMTALQKSVLTVFVKALEDESRRGLFQSLIDVEAPIYFTSAYGEVSAMLRVTQEILAQTLPISPKDFQHSVLNAAIAYLCMFQKSQQPGFALSGGYESQDLAVHLAARRISSGLDAAALIIHAHEWNDGGKDENAQAELLLLSASQEKQSLYTLHALDQSYDRPDAYKAVAPQGEANASHYDEEQAQGSVAWLLNADHKLELKRSLRNSFGLELQSEWREMS